MAGIGARNQCRILSSPVLADLGIGRLILQPQGDPSLLRRWLDANRFRIVEENLLRIRGRFHLTLAAEPGEADKRSSERGLTDEDLFAAGPLLVRSGDPVVRKYWESQLKRLLRLEARRHAGPGGEQTVRNRKQAERILEALPPDTI
jgi:tRNA A22 N-methylase